MRAAAAGAVEVADESHGRAAGKPQLPRRLGVVAPTLRTTHLLILDRKVGWVKQGPNICNVRRLGEAILGRAGDQGGWALLTDATV